MSKFDPELYKCKAILLEDDMTVIHGFYSQNQLSKLDAHWISVDSFDPEMEGYYLESYEINPFTLCRNTGIKIKNNYLYEYDLVRYGNGLSKESQGYIDYDDYTKRWVIRTSLNYSTHADLSKYNIEILGNIMLSKEDNTRMQKYSDESEANHTPDVKVECRSTQRLNKIARQFLPK